MTQGAPHLPKLGIIAGGGVMPCLVADAALSSGREVHIIALDGEADSGIENYPHSWIKWGEIGRLFKTLKSQKCQDVVLIGSVSRPDMTKVRFDLGAIKILPFIFSLMVGGDDSILSRIVKFFEKKGYTIRGAHEVAPDLVAPEGCLTKRTPSSQDKRDIETALQIVQTLGTFDIGQGAVVTKGYALAVEAAEGTDAMLDRCADLRQWGGKWSKKKVGVLVKCPKPGQEKRVDMPTIGVQTVEKVAAAGLSGIAIAAHSVLLADKENLIKTANERDVFVIGLPVSERVS